MRRRSHKLLVASCIVLASLPLANQAANASQRRSPEAPQVKKLPRTKSAPDRPAVDPSTVLVRFDGRAGGLGRPGIRVGPRVRGTDYFEVSSAGRDARAFVRRLRHDTRVRDVELNFVRRITSEPNDQLYDTKWGSAQWAASVRLPQAWDQAPGPDDVAIAVVDTGVEASHPDLQGRVLDGFDFANDDSDAADDEGHGTFVAGIAGGKRDNGRGVAGVSQARILPVKVLDSSGAGTDADIAAGITWSADHGADVINLSLGGPGRSAVLEQAISYALDAGSLVVAASGNSASDVPIYPAAIPDVVAVSATDWAGNFAWFSSFGSWVDLAAPGMEMISTYPGGYAQGSGTSFAAPVVAGAAAMFRNKVPTASVGETRAALLASARDVGPVGIDPQYGVGLLDIPAALGAPRQSRVRGAAPDALEPNDVADRAKNVPFWGVDGSTNPNPISATIAPEGDVDWYYTDITESRWASFGVGLDYRAPDIRAQEWDPVVRVYGPDLRLLGEADHEGVNMGEVVYLHVAPGRYYIEVSSNAGAVSPTTYQVSSGIGARYMTDTRFQPFQSYSAPDASHVAVGDVTGDGRSDVVMTTEEGSYADPTDFSLFVYDQRDDGWLGRPDVYPLGPSLPQVAIGDMNDDGRKDVIVGGREHSRFFLQDPDGGLTDPLAGPPATQMEIADIDSNGRDDIVTLTDNGFAVHRNTAAGFVTSTVTTPGYAVELEVGDVTADGVLDVVTITGWASTPWGADVHAQTGVATFAAPIHLAAETSGDTFPHGVAVGDVTGDNRADVTITLGYNSGTRLNVFRQTTGGFAPPAVHPVRSIPSAIEARDIDLDGRGDLALVHDGFQEAGVVLQKSDGTLATEATYSLPYATSYKAKGLALDDITGDGFPDISVADYNNGLVVLRQKTPGWPRLSPPWIRNTTPSNLAEGQSAAISPTVRFGPDVDPSAVTSQNVELLDGDDLAPIPASLSFNAATDQVTIDPSASLEPGPYLIRVAGIATTSGRPMPDSFESRFVVGATLDTSPPDTYIFRGASGTEATGFWRFWFNASEPGTRFQCRFDGGGWFSCISSDWSSMARDNLTHSFEVRAIDGAGNIDPTPAQGVWTIDENANRPQYDCLCLPVVLSGESGSDTTRANIQASKATNEEPAIALNPGGRDIWYRWTSPSSGLVTFDTGGSTFDTLLGVFTGANEDYGSLRNATLVTENDDVSRTERTSKVSFFAREGTTYQIVVDGFNDGFWVATGQVDLSWAMTPDTTQPAVAIDSPPSGAVRNAAVSITASASDAGGIEHVRFLVDGAVVSTDSSEPYSAQWDSTGAADGPHTIVARARDRAGNETTSEPRVITTDNTAPETSIDSGPSGTTEATSATFDFSSSEEEAAFECSLDGAVYSTCASPEAYDGLTDGVHTFKVRSSDPLGNHDPTPATRNWTIATGGDPPPIPSTHARSITLFLRRHLVAKGRLAVNDGYSECRAGVPVQLQRRTGDRWSTVARDVTGGLGYFSVRVRDRTGIYRAVAVRASLGTDHICSRAVSLASRHRHG
jgi:subtilisin family serine protease